MTAIRIDHWVKLGTTIKEARLAHGWSQHSLAARANVSRSWLARVEAGHRGAELEPLLRVLSALNITIRLDTGRLDEGHLGDEASGQPVHKSQPSAPTREQAWGLR